jgi:hypothetical protein
LPKYAKNEINTKKKKAKIGCMAAKLLHFLMISEKNAYSLHFYSVSCKEYAFLLETHLSFKEENLEKHIVVMFNSRYM